MDPQREFERVRGSYEERVRELGETIAQRERELVILSHVAERVHGEDQVPRILQIALEEILKRMDLNSAWIFGGSEENRKLELIASQGVAPCYLEEIERDGLEECLCPEVFWSGHRMQARNTTQCPRMPTIVEGLNAPVAHACIPLRFEKGHRGVLNVAARPGQVFSDDELRFLETLGHQIGLAVERARHLESERLRNQEARALAAVAKAIGGSLDASAVLQAVGDTVREVLGADRVHILLGSDPAAIRVAHVGGMPHPELREGQLIDLVALGATVQRAALERRRPFAVDDVTTDAVVGRELAARWDAASGMAVPLLVRDRAVGVLVLARSRPHRWLPQQIEIAEALAAQAAVALENARLFDDARRAYQELKDAQQRIIGNERMAVLGTFAAGLAHEVRNPLNSMALQLSILERRIARCETMLANEMSEVAAVIREEIRRLDGLVGDFLLFSRTDRLQASPVSLDALVEEVVRLLRPEARSQGVVLRTERRGGAVPSLRMDGEKMKQVVLNLVRNALEAMPGGGRVTVEVGLFDGRVQLTVKDDGPGLPEGIDVFQVFVTTKPKGTGLGLSIVQQIILQHGGEIVATNQPQGGACFSITLPMVPGESAPVVSGAEA